MHEVSDFRLQMPIAISSSPGLNQENRDGNQPPANQSAI
jgi:hypothetical protein